jgi:ribosomal protein L11 methyltransferase
VWSILIPAPSLSPDSLSAELWELGTAGILEEQGGWRVFFDESVDRAPICARFDQAERPAQNDPPFDPSSLPPLECDPILIGERFYIAPSWLNEPAPEGRFRLTMDSSSAFGSGRHESTQLCIEALEQHLKPGSMVVDIGCGSGILSAAAHLLGAAAILSCDIHADSVRTAKTLLETPLFVGSADAIQTGIADLVLANISAKIVDVLAADLRRIAKPSGLLVLAGFLSENPPKRFRPREILKKGDWECWITKPEDVEVQAYKEPTAHAEQWWL